MAASYLTDRPGRAAATLAIIATAIFASSVATHALTKDAAIESCRMRVGKPIVMSCMRGGGDSLEACRARATPAVRSCVMSSLEKANKRANVALALPTEGASKQRPGVAAPVGFVAPPRTITDIAAILDSEKPDPAKLEKLKADADAASPSGASRTVLAQFYLDRGNARGELGRLADSIADAEKGMAAGRGAASPALAARLVQLAALQYGAAGDPKKAVALYQQFLRDTANIPNAKGFVHVTNRSIASFLISSGDLSQAEGVMRRSQMAIDEARTSGNPAMRAIYAKIGQNWESELELGRGYILDAQGQYKEAELAYRNAEVRKRAGMKSLLALENPPTESSLLLAIDLVTLNLARVKARQGRLAEAEVDARRALLSRLRDLGKYHASTTRFIMGLAGILVEQGRHADAERLLRIALEINETTGIPGDSPSTVQVLSQLGGVLNLQRKSGEAVGVFARLERSISSWEPRRRQMYELNGSRIISLYNSGQYQAGIAAAEQLVQMQIARVGVGHFDTASARGTLAVGLMRAGRDVDALREFRSAIPTLVASRDLADDDDSTTVAARNQRLQATVEAYLKVLARQQAPATAVGEETFGLADAIRGGSVQAALAASSVRGAAKDPALAEMVRKDQDLSKQINAQIGSLNNALSLASTERDEKSVQSLNASIAMLRAERSKLRQDINGRFPAFGQLVAPKAPSVDEIRQTLAPDEAMISFYFGQDSSFVWAVPKSGAVAFATIAAGASEIQGKVRKLREALEPQAAMISDIPAFDVALGHELYSLLLAPVDAAWKPAKQLIIVTNGALGLLPLSLLPTAPSTLKADEELLFASYRDVPWLARTHAVSMVPSAAALRTLRQLPPVRTDRSELIAFGDPYFSTEQQAEAEQIDAKIQIASARDPDAMRSVR